jgi:hypothetical protein
MSVLTIDLARPPSTVLLDFWGLGMPRGRANRAGRLARLRRNGLYVRVSIADSLYSCTRGTTIRAVLSAGGCASSFGCSSRRRRGC